MQLFVIRGNDEIPALALGPLPVYVGRGPDNHLVLSDATVSSRHAVFWVEGERAWLRDCGSMNGTFLGEERVRGPVTLADGDTVRLGNTATLVARGRCDAGGRSARARPWALLDVEAGLTYPMLDGRFILGVGEGVDLRLDMEPDEETAIAVDTNGEVWRSTVDADEPMALGEAFHVGGRTFRVVEADQGLTLTRDGTIQRAFEYRLTATLDGVAGAEALLEHPGTGHRHVIEAENRAVLLYVLARRSADAREADDPEAESWCADDDVSTAVWGKRGGSDGNSLHVLVHRLRKELKTAGFDPWFLEKRRKAIRVALRDVVVR